MLITDLEKQVSDASWTLGSVVTDFILAAQSAICAAMFCAFGAPDYGWVSAVMGFVSGCMFTMALAKRKERRWVRAMLRGSR